MSTRRIAASEHASQSSASPPGRSGAFTPDDAPNGKSENRPTRAFTTTVDALASKATPVNRQADLWDLLDPVVRAERARQAAPINRYQSPPPARSTTSDKRSPDQRVLTTREAAEYLRVSIKTFMTVHAPHLHPIPSSTSSSKRRHLRWDRRELDSYIDRLTGRNDNQELSRGDLGFVKAQMEKRLE
jgi:hypothetical protein